MSTNLVERLKKYGKDMSDWERMRTSVTGVSIVKLPSKSEDLNFGLELLPVKEDGIPVKKKGLFITSTDQWEAFKELFNSSKAFDLITTISELKKERAVEPAEESEEVFEI
ncbi:MAG: hypothetical protein HGN29_00880 [Asgard group archaeon]|nr:hypothetical protein [Asgard group archaeon]